jgi:citronellyl-CoA dehydrogenase
MLSSETAQVFFDNVRVPQRYRIGQEGAGFTMQMLQFQEERLFAAANSLRFMERVIDETVAYARERKIFGQRCWTTRRCTSAWPSCKCEVECLRSLVYRACEMYISGQDVLQLASMAKLKVGRLTREVADSCLQYWGGNGFMWDNPAGQLYRDGRLGSIGGGADEVMLGIICKTMGTLPGR